MTIIESKIEDGVAILTWDQKDKPMNVLNGDALAELDAAILAAAGDEAVQGIILTSGKQGVFVAGGDLDQISSIGSGPIDAEDLFTRTEAIHQQLRRMETCGKPVVAALNGVTLGGGFEIALACHRRIIVDSRFAKVGLPEAGMGLMPGAGGTQRLPRLIGIQNGVGLILQGKQLDPQKALASGLVDEVVPADQLIAAAKKWIADGGEGVQPWDKKGFKIPGGGMDTPAGAQTLMGSNAMVHANTFGNIPSAQAILQSVYSGAQLPMDRAGRVEIREFIKLLQGPVARSMLRTLFFSLQEAQKGVRRPKDVPQFAVKKVGILGAGLMGRGIAHDSAKAKLDVVLLDVNDALAEAGKAQVEKSLARKIKKGRLTQEKADALLSRIQTTSNYDDLAGCDVIVEAVKEDRKIKDIVIKAANAQLGDDAILGSNTSGLPITDLAESSTRPENFIGLHFFSPVEKMHIVEVVMGEKTSEATLAKAWDFLLKIKKAGIVVKDSPDFYTSRVIGTFVTEMGIALSEGVAPALIENTAKMAGMPMAPMVVSDMMGLGTMNAVAERKKADCEAQGKEFVPSPTQPVIQVLVEKHGRFGMTPPPLEDGTPRKPGGFYDYFEDGSKRLWSGLGDALKEAGIAPEGEPAQPSKEDMVARYLYTQGLEAARCFEEGVIKSPAEADVGVVMAVGFPAYTGGPCSYMDSVGLAEFVAEADRLEAAYGERFKAPQLLRDMAAEGKSWY